MAPPQPGRLVISKSIAMGRPSGVCKNSGRTTEPSAGFTRVRIVNHSSEDGDLVGKMFHHDTHLCINLGMA
jgi:hypothetical protein